MDFITAIAVLAGTAAALFFSSSRADKKKPTAGWFRGEQRGDALLDPRVAWAMAEWRARRLAEVDFQTRELWQFGRKLRLDELEVLLPCSMEIQEMRQFRMGDVFVVEIMTNIPLVLPKAVRCLVYDVELAATYRSILQRGSACWERYAAATEEEKAQIVEEFSCLLQLEKGFLHFLRRDYSQAVQIFDHLSATLSGRYAGLCAQGWVLLRQYQFTAAIALLDQAIDAYADHNLEAYVLRARCFCALGDWDAALLDIGQIRPLAGYSLEFVALQARVRGMLGQWDVAREELQQVLAGQPASAGAVQLLLAQLAAAQGNWADARQLGMAAEGAPDLVVKRELLLARCALGEGNETEAELRFGLALQADPLWLDTYRQRGIFFQEQGRVAEARADFLRVTELFPQEAESYADLGRLYQRQGDFLRAVDAYKSFLRWAMPLHPDVPIVQEWLRACWGRQQGAGTTEFEA